MKSLKIVYICRSIIPSKTANSVNVVKMCSAFASLGHQVTLLAPITKKLEEKDVENIFEFYGVEKNFEIKKLFSPSIKFLKKRIYSFRCLNQVKKINPDLVYGRDDLLSFYLTQKFGYKTLFERHDSFSKNSIDEKLFKKFIDNNTNEYKLVTNTQKLKEYYCKEYNLSYDYVHVASSATDVVSDFDTIPDDCEKFKNAFNVGYIGKLGKMRGLEIIIKLAESLPNMYFHIVGGDEKDIKYWKNEAGILNNIIFHGFINPKNTYKYRNLCNVLLAPYINADELFDYMSPIKAFEYMVSKTPMICSDSKIIRETINENCSILADNNDMNSWINALNKLYNDVEFRKKLIEKAYQYCLENFTYESRSKKILDFIGKNN
ncbi:glycosyltransferase [Aliarcobacter butzleri]|uniref:glycosyltransferase n=1 Tax=Aliarcobacter butzleri TaxID=28197 RepID=UPI0018A0C73D|nr:glycosyltransferase [Aliarcobacter butzleri]MBF7071122.1 glycosyltransferase [Aliarcobacter butzleri]MCT7645984.1 glycosyltransferase [Aliarcobacter butzleri]MDK2083240.1 glycosyltransferase [Aliarcobacter butzleri]MDN5128276.1 glycosyltransferase [Aliarcobacter butzleri]